MDPAVRIEIQDLYDRYVDCLDEDELERWPELFTEHCLYEVLPRENYERGLPLATMLCESRPGLLDRVRALRETSTYAPRYVRHLVSNLRIREDADGFRVRANFAVLETRPEARTEILASGRYEDRIVRDAGQLRFREKRCINDTLLVPNSLVYPI